MTTDAASAWLHQIQPQLEAVLVDGLAEVARSDCRQFSGYQLAMAFEEQFKLGDGEDCLYDRPGTGFAYASWYQPRRVNELVTRLLPLIEEMPREVRILDLGAGTGATIWALALARQAVIAVGGRVPHAIEVFSVDTSPSMLEASHMLQDALRAHDPSLLDGIVDRQVHRPWVDPPPDAAGGWVIAGHLFDASDPAEEVVQQMRRLLMNVQPERVLVDAPKPKLLQQASAAEGADAVGWETVPLRPAVRSPFGGSLRAVADLRRRHFGALGVDVARLRHEPTWDRHHVLHLDLVRGSNAGDRLFLPQLENRTLDEDQDRLALPADRFEVLVGAAGSGKSLVIAERVVRTVAQETARGQPIDILVTTRNVQMIETLVRWIVGGLADRGVAIRRSTCRASGDHVIELATPGSSRLRFLNWDKVPTQLFGAVSTGSSDEDTIKRRIQALERAGWEPLDRHAELRDVDWLAAELRRVIHAQRLRTAHDYEAAARTGRIRPLQPSVRRHVWTLLMEDQQQRSYTRVWMETVDRLGSVLDDGSELDTVRFTHVFADEVQDFSATDIKVMAAMVPDARRLFVAGDAGQAMLLGTTFDIPGILRRRARQVHTLNRSYRLPRRLAEAVAPLAERIAEGTPANQRHWVGVPTGTRSGVLGFRPIVISRDRVDVELPEALSAYQSVFAVDDPTVTIAEGRWRDDDLLALCRRALPNVKITCETMAAIKGLERTAVVWATGSRWRLDEAGSEFVHTVLTRAVSLAILVVETEGTSDDILEALSVLRADRLLFWSEQAKGAWASLMDRSAPC